MPPSTGSKMRDAGKKTGDSDESESKKLQLTKQNENFADNWADNWAENIENKTVEGVSKSEKVEKRPESSSKYKTSSKHGAEGKKLEKTSSDKNRLETEGKEKRGSSVIQDKVPKKNAQRAKGSLSINKTVKSEENAKKKPAFSADNLPRTQTASKRELTRIASKESPPSMQKPKVSEKSLRISSNRKHKEDVKEGDKKHSIKKKKSSALLAEEDSEEIIKKEESQLDNVFQEGPFKESGFGCAAPPPSSSCSFFGKIQQGVRAYFMSRNSLKFEPAADDKTKKNITEGGINLD